MQQLYVGLFRSLAILSATIVTFGSPLAAETAATEKAAVVSAQDKSAKGETPWLYENSNVPVDTSWTFGTLDNGIRYAVKHNDVPSGQISIRIRIDAGALYEKDDELGYAHLMEHLSFRGSTYVPDGESKRIWQRFGVTFGNDSNAQTTPTQTVYKLDLPSATPEMLDESMKILSGMMRSPNISAEAVDAESRIVQAELRESDGPQRDLSDMTRKTFFAGQLLAERSPIGTVESLRAASVEKLRAFHSRWYRPENMVISIAGDIEPTKLENLVRKYFADWKVAGTPAPQPNFGRPDPKAPSARVFVAPTLPMVLNLGYMRAWEKVDDTIEYNEGLMLDAVARQIVNRRLEYRARKGASFLQAQVDQDDVSRSVDATFVTVMPRDNDWESALREVRAVIADALNEAPSQADIDREVTEFANAFRISFDSYPFEAAAKQADNIVEAVDIRETVATPKVALDVFTAMRDKFTPEAMLKSTRAQFAGDATRILLTTPVEPEGGEQALAAALTAPVIADPDARLAEGTLGIEALPNLGPPGTVSKSIPIPELDMEMVELSNGIRALLYSNEAENDKIKVAVRFGRGAKAFAPDKDGRLMWTSGLGLMQSGVGELDQEALDQLANGKRLGLAFGVDNDAFEFSADTRPDDLELQLKLFAAKLAEPRWDPAPVERMKALYASGYDSYEMSASSVLQRDLNYLLRARDPRWKVPTPDEVRDFSADDFRKLWAPRLQSGPVEILLFGDFDKQKALEYLAATFGALPPREPVQPLPAAATIAFPEPVAEPVVKTHKGPSDQAAAVIAWPTGGGEDVRTSRHLEILKEIFQDRLFEGFRTLDAASYSPYVMSDWPEEFASGGYFAAISQVNPDNVSLFIDKAKEIAADLAARPVSEDELARAVKPMEELIIRASSGNTFWLINLKGATRDPGAFGRLSTTLTDFRSATPQDLQALAAKYLLPGKAWTMTVLPEGKKRAASE